MKEIIIITREELVEIIDESIIRNLTKLIVPSKQPDARFLYSLRELAEFLGCSTTTAQNLKNGGRIRYKQYGRKLIFNSAEVLEDLDKGRR
jgi:hypothetical protein